MVTRVSALLLFASVLCSAPVYADHKGGEGGELSPEERTCQFQIEVPPILAVSPCIEFRDKLAFLLVLTNTRNRVCVESDDFQRHERDCEGDLLDTIDTIPAEIDVEFVELQLCSEGSPLEVKELEGDCWCVNPHRGGYFIVLEVKPGESDICDDAGCYTAEVKVTITAEPFEECP